ncbi:MAG: DUF1553 domain-containing protein [Bacteroidia bacterium]|nr:DUF1553 domain-containing protein [Bacteroidia bacterium]
MKHWSLSLIPILCLLLACSKGEEEKIAIASIPDKIDFNFHVKPILSDRCFKCHGPDEKVREANLRLDIKEGAFAMLDSSETSYAIVAGDLDASSLYHRIISNNPETVMPPPESNLSLEPHEIEILKKWIEQGAEWKDHWAFIPPQKTETPKKNSGWGTNEIDQFTRIKMEEQGLQPSPEASKEKLIRRLSFDLRGLPPDIKEIDAFLEDDSPDAYEKIIDAFMESESFGERLAMEWLDVSRYADSHGYQDDIERSMWPWRDWVIKAFNENLPYDQFVSWQLAGDLLPEPTYEQKLATGFNRNHKITQEVGVVDEEYRVEYVLDRVHTVSTSFLGLTMACAQCHDHKFDPISQKEFYQMFSFFNSVPEAGRVEYNVEVAEPSLPLPEETVESYKAYTKKLVQDQSRELAEYEKLFFSKEIEEEKLKPNEPQEATIPKGLLAYFPLDYLEDDIVKEEKGRIRPGKAYNQPVPVSGYSSGALEFNSKNYLDLGKIPDFNPNKAFSFSCWLYSVHGGAGGAILAPIFEGEEKARGMDFYVSWDRHLEFSLKGRVGKQLLKIRSREEIPPDRWVQVSLTYDGSRSQKGVSIYLDGEQLEGISLSDDLKSSVKAHSRMKIGRRAEERGMISGRLDELMFFNRRLDQQEVQELKHYNPLANLEARKVNDADKRLAYQYLHSQDKTYQRHVQRLKEYKIREMRTEDIILKPTMIMADMDSLRPTYMLDRGSYEAPTERVYPATPAHILSFPEELPKNRLGFAQWLFHAENPLTARVAVNRYWQMIFGRGIVGTPEDFGSQGDLPTHPELLDWLAIDFRESGWDLKALLKKMLMSATYRQSVASNKKLQEIDPQNIYLARGPVVRLQAEMVRDHALAVSGLLSPKIGGPSVKPYHPDGLWLETASGNQPLRKYIQDHGQDLYRKSMYTFWKRTIPPPSMIIFDAPPREECTVRRQSTSTPMQALVMLNDPQFIEASRLIAERMLREGGSNDRDRISFAFKLATSRAASDKELELLEELLIEHRQAFKKDPPKAVAYLNIGEYPDTEEFDKTELAAYAQLANAILNLTESIQKA